MKLPVLPVCEIVLPAALISLRSTVSQMMKLKHLSGVTLLSANHPNCPAVLVVLLVESLN